MVNKSNDFIAELLSEAPETVDSLKDKQRLFKESPLVSTQQLAQHLDISERLITELVGKGFIPKVSRGRFNLFEATAGYVRYTKQLCIKKLII